MKTYTVLMEWTNTATMEIEAESEKEALEKVDEVGRDTWNEVFSRGEYSKYSLTAIDCWDDNE